MVKCHNFNKPAGQDKKKNTVQSHNRQQLQQYGNKKIENVGQQYELKRSIENSHNSNE